MPKTIRVRNIEILATDHPAVLGLTVSTVLGL